MANSLEVRAPMLDKDIIEYAFNQVPSKFKATTGMVGEMVSTQLDSIVSSLLNDIFPSSIVR